MLNIGSHIHQLILKKLKFPYKFVDKLPFHSIIGLSELSDALTVYPYLGTWINKSK